MDYHYDTANTICFPPLLIRAPSVANSFTQQQRPPSVVGSDTGYRNGARHSSNPAGGIGPQHNVSYPRGGGGRGGGARQPFHVVPNRPGSVTGSIEGRLAAGRMTGVAGGAARLQQLRGGQRGGGGGPNSSMQVRCLWLLT